MIGCNSLEREDQRTCTVLVLDPEGSAPTRSTLPDESLVSDINLFIYNSEGLLEERRFLSGRRLSVKDGTVQLKTSLLRGVPYDIFVAANIGYALPLLSRKDIESYRYHLAYPDEYTRGMPMSAHLDGYVNEGEAEVLLPLVRTMARIDVNIDRTKLDSDVTFQVTSVHVGNGPSSVRLFGDSRAESATQVFAGGFSLEGRQVQALNIDQAPGVSGSVSLYLPENLQGDLLTTDDERGKVFSEGQLGKVCSYLEIRGSYHSNSWHTRAGEPLVYRFYLGDGPGNFDVFRNTACKVTVHLEGTGLGEDGWRIDKDRLIPETRFSLHPAAYNECRSGDDFHLWCDVFPADVDFEIEPVAWDDDESVRRLYTFDIDPDGHGLTIHTWKGGSVMVYFKAGPPVNRDTLAIVVIDP
ncbi:MAG: DUF4906 domain-containing protein [Bacteroidales bacterium]|nr:DUF4906 domain-containing protein [Bacteroidales bacterium]